MWKKLCSIMLLAIFVLSGCRATVTENNLSGIHLVKANEKLGEKTQAERAQSIKALLHNINGITGNAVIVEGHTAIIGLRLEEGMESDATRLRKEADNAAREADEYINNTSITTNVNIVSLIEEMERKRGK
ncbi:YhcN/YlaJ family sporulation lipoprotein [Anaerotignum propionicum]|uniref:Sporulation lipoprotein YhcN/YlaJ n=1 Tax=Anaerotignum propionicum DSM 1682 TaxID=991789 RepID=A0A0X8VBQ1_ANAPI|nr:YhcN/YlaJ family sporulation lipoprotein [Anaerotignum propionicum]AMJ39840.1 sporulation lipoprotein YhcN/YlaJ [Anaerotignum propionicum DSM 1682]SHE27938.1 Sporulation lipoprotein YhcN/YlaJ (Spore_YhcN_YlaJ) [[Clostridium] propionicum DSM 1682] [Anaerotignum propionicum DSM 1682]